MATSKRAKAGARRYWLFKSDPQSYSIDDLELEPNQTTFWDGVRNYQARNLLRDEVQVGDGVLLYHSSTEPLAIVGVAQVVKAGYPDHTAWDPASPHFDPKSKPESPTWYMVDIQLVQKFQRPLERSRLLGLQEFENMVLLQRGSRLSVQPVTAAQWQGVNRIAGLTQQ